MSKVGEQIAAGEFGPEMAGSIETQVILDAVKKVIFDLGITPTAEAKHELFLFALGFYSRGLRDAEASQKTAGE